MNILFLSRWYPDPPDNGAKIRILNLLKSLCAQHSVTLISFANPEENISSQNFPDPRPREIRVCPYFEFNPKSRRAVAGYFSAKPRWIVDTYRPEMESLIRKTVAGNRFDLIIASQTEMAAYFECFGGIPAIFEELELGCFYPDGTGNPTAFDRMRMKLRWAKHRRFIAGLLPHFHFCTVASEIERRMAGEAAPGFRSVHVIPNSIDAGLYDRPAAERSKDSMIFTGSLRYAANLDAMSWFLNEIYPAVRSVNENARLTITGDPGPNHLPPHPNVTTTGRVQDVHGLIAGSTVSIAPIRIGGGTRFKILESFALGTPVVATSKAAEGLEARSGEHFLCADTSEDFAQSVIDLLRQPNWQPDQDQWVATFMQTITTRDDLIVQRLEWSTGILIAVKR